MPLQKLLTPDETADLLGVAKDTLTLWRCTKRVSLPYVKIGRLVRYDPAEVASFIERRTVPGTAELADAGR